MNEKDLKEFLYNWMEYSNEDKQKKIQEIKDSEFIELDYVKKKVFIIENYLTKEESTLKRVETESEFIKNKENSMTEINKIPKRKEYNVYKILFFSICFLFLIVLISNIFKPKEIKNKENIVKKNVNELSQKQETVNSNNQVVETSKFKEIEDRINRNSAGVEEDSNSNEEYRVHVYGTYNGTYKEGTSMSNHDMTFADILVTDTEKPLILVLTSYEPITWKIKKTSGVNISKIIYDGYYDSIFDCDFVVNTEIMKNLNFNSIRTRDEYLDAIKNVEEITGYKPKTIQSGNLEKIVIDGKNTMEFQNQKEKFYIGNVAERVLFEKTARGDGKISPDGLTVSGFMLLVNRGYKKGKWYFETSPNIINQHKDTFSGSDVGIATTAYGGFSAPIGGEYGYSYSASNGNFHEQNNTIINFNDLKNNDVIGIAMDLDNSKIYFSLNGEWKNGIPNEKIRGYKIQADRFYYAACATSNRGDEGYGDVSWTFNFGRTPFRYSIPIDFEAYDVN